MRTVRACIFAVVATIVVGSVGLSGLYACYLHGATCRAAAAAKLSEALGLPADIGEVVPLSFNKRQFNDIQVWLPDRRGLALRCLEAVVIETPTRDDPDAYELVLNGGHCEISPRTWLREDYRNVIESGLRPGFAPDGPRQVTFRGMDLAFERERFHLRLEGTSGVVAFDTPQSGAVRATCTKLNGHESRSPVLLGGTFSPRLPGIQVDSIALTIPELPLRILGLAELAGTDIRSGTFDGRVEYSECGGRKLLALKGRCRELDLAELTATLPRPWRGRCPEVELNELRIEDRRPVAISFHGELTGVAASDVLAPWGLGDVGGEMDLNVRTADLSHAGITKLIARGECRGVSLERVTGAIGLGRMSGDLNVAIDDLTIVENHIGSLAATLRVTDAWDPPNWIEGALLREVVKRVLHFSLPPLLPERVQYTRLGLRVDVTNEELRVRGTHGDGERTILTARIFGKDIELVKEPATSFNLGPALDDARRRLAELLRGPLEELERRTGGPPGSSVSDPGPRSE